MSGNRRSDVLSGRHLSDVRNALDRVTPPTPEVIEARAEVDRRFKEISDTINRIAPLEPVVLRSSWLIEAAVVTAALILAALILAAPVLCLIVVAKP